MQLVAISAGTGQPSTTRMLTDRIAAKVDGASLTTIELAPLAVDIARAAVNGVRSPDLQAASDRLAAADGVIAATPVYKAGISGLFKSFVDVLDNDLLVAKPVVLAATAGSSRHALVADEQLRPLFAYMRALTAPTSVTAAPEDWGSPELGEHIDRAAAELAVLMHAGVEQQIADRVWSSYTHEPGTGDIDFDSPLMRLATGGSAAPARG